jgi:hypothetical protein
LVFLCNIDKSFEAKMLCLLALLAGWLAGWAGWLLSHTCCNSREHKYIDLIIWVVCKIYRKNQSLDSVNKLCSKVCTKLCVRTGGLLLKLPVVERSNLLLGINHEFFKLGLFIWMSLLLACFACLPTFLWLFSSNFEEIGCYPTCHFHAWDIIEALGKVITDDGSVIPFFTICKLVTQIVICNKFCTMEWNGSNDGVYLGNVTYPNWGWNEKSGWKQYTGNKTGEQSSFLT